MESVLDRRIGDSDALDKIAELMSGEEWNSETFDEIADIVRATMREVKDIE